MEIFIPPKIRAYLDGLSAVEDKIGQSDAGVWMFDDMVLKIEHQSKLTDQQNTMLRWLEGKLPVPQVLVSETVGDMQYLIMSRIHGKMACAEENMCKPRETITAVAEGLKQLWAVDITGCPVINSLDRMLTEASERLSLLDRRQWKGHFDTPEEQLAYLVSHKPEEDWVLSHGDFCMPNIMLENGNVSGFVDLGQCALADRWYDVTMMLQSMERNFTGFFGGRSYEGYDPSLFFEKLEIVPNKDRLLYYRMLDELF